MNKRAFFCKQLAAWFFQVDWHYSTLLGITINCVDKPPTDCNALINEVLLQFPEKPPERVISAYLLTSTHVSTWFNGRTPSPKIKQFNLDSPTCVVPANKLHPPIDTLKDLAEWLALTPSQLNWFANIWRIDGSTPRRLQHYQYQMLEKRDGGVRLIEKPKATLKQLQRKIYHEILSNLETHPMAHGFAKGRSCHSHAAVHIGKRYLLLFDITECFQSIDWPMVKSVFKRLGYPDAVAVHLTALCTHRVNLKPAQLAHFNDAQKNRLRQRHLPQGAPSSPALANAALRGLDSRLAGLARHLGLDYSRYADDIAMSSNHHRDWRFVETLIGAICLDEGVTLNNKKTRIKKYHQKQRVVGIVVNSKANVDRQYFDTLKATLTNCKRYGLESQNHNQHPHFRAHLLGRIQYVKSLNEHRGLKLERIYQDIAE